MSSFIAFYRTEDLIATRHFYEELLELKLVKDQEVCLIFETSSTAAIGFCTHHPKDPTTGACLTFVFESTTDVDAWHTKLSDKGLNPTPTTYNERFKIYHFFVRDPNQYMVEFQVFL